MMCKYENSSADDVKPRSVTSAGERPRLMKIMSGMPLISARSLETTRVRISLFIISVHAAFGAQMELIMPHSNCTDGYLHPFVV